MAGLVYPELSRTPRPAEEANDASPISGHVAGSGLCRHRGLGVMRGPPVHAPKGLP